MTTVTQDNDAHDDSENGGVEYNTRVWCGLARGGAENRNAPNGTAALSSVANSEAARYVFVVVVVHDVMIAGRRYGTFVLA